MDTDVVIRAQGIAKKYLIGHQSAAERNGTFRDMLARNIRTWARSARDMSRGQAIVAGDETEEFWALKDINFEIRRGEVVGIIGRNGAGKSTLLKILSRITDPSYGRVEITGRVASLLEVGTGFHPELSGRENIYLNGSILGMTRAEVRRKFDEIVSFADVSSFLDTPVKRYSSGMYVRLAFAVAAHLEPEILIIDEVLAVGDAEFQRRCLGKMQEVAGQGRTVLFVSHNLGAVARLCNSAFVLGGGRLLSAHKDVSRAISEYLTSTDLHSGIAEWRNTKDDFQHPIAQPLSMAILRQDGSKVSGPCRGDEQLTVSIEALVTQVDPALNLGIAVYGPNSEILMWSLTTDGPELQWPTMKRGLVTLRCGLPRRILNEGTYRIELIMSLHCREWLIPPGFNGPSVSLTITGGLSDSPYWLSARPGLFAPVLAWHAVPDPAGLIRSKDT